MTSQVTREPLRRPGVHPTRPRILLGLLLLAVAMPLRIPVDAPVISSVSILDLLLVVAAFTLVLDLPFRPLAVGYPAVLWLLSVPVLATVLSLAWSQDRTATLAVLGFTLEGVVGYLFVTRELEGLPGERVVSLLERLTVLLIVPAVLLLLGVPGFEPRQPELSVTSGDYLSYFTRLSHPILGRSNNLATVVVVFVPVLLWWGHTHRRRSSTFVGFLGLAAVAATQSRGVLLAGVVGLAVYLLARPPVATGERAALGKVVAGVGALVVSSVAFFLLNPFAREFGASRLSGENFSLRTTLLAEAFEHLRERPVLGFGPGVVPDRDSALTVDLHNTYVQQLLSFGVPLGFVVSLSLLALPVWFLVKARADVLPVAGVVGLALTIEALSFAFESSFEGSVLRVVYYISVGLLAGLVRAERAT